MTSWPLSANLARDCRATLRRAARWTRHAVSPLASLVLPASCWSAGDPLTPADGGLSHAVREEIARQLLWPYCRACGATTGRHANYGVHNPCPLCAERILGLASVVRVGTFSAPLDGLVRTLKFGRHWELARLLAPFLYQAISMQTCDGQETPVDVLVPVALHWQRRFSRGFNQSEELAREVTRLSKWPTLNILRRVRPTHEQALTQSRAQRLENLQGAFACLPDPRLAKKHVWLIDDVSTTGATLHAAATAFRRLPKNCRPAALHAAVLCVTDRTPVPSSPA